MRVRSKTKLECRNIFSRIHFTVYCTGGEKIDPFKKVILIILEPFVFTLRMSINQKKFNVLFLLSILCKINVLLINNRSSSAVEHRGVAIQRDLRDTSSSLSMLMGIKLLGIKQRDRVSS